MARAVRRGRGAQELNFSEWQRPQEEADEAAEKVQEGEMPLKVYTFMHSHARLDAGERARLIEGLAKTLGERHRERDGDRP